MGATIYLITLLAGVGFLAGGAGWFLRARRAGQGLGESASVAGLFLLIGFVVVVISVGVLSGTYLR